MGRGGPVTDEARREFEADLAEVSAARSFVVAAVEEWGLPSDDPALVVTELATNAVLHAETPFTVSITRDRSRLKIEVTDTGPGLPAIRGRTPLSTIGMGLVVVDALSHWGVHRHFGHGKTVWAELDLG